MAAVQSPSAVDFMASPISTPSLFKGGSPPWVEQTPTPVSMQSQMPSFHFKSQAAVPSQDHNSTGPRPSSPLLPIPARDHSLQPVPATEAPTASPQEALSEDLLREICAPFFVEMARAVQHAMNKEKNGNARKISLASIVHCASTMTSDLKKSNDALTGLTASARTGLDKEASTEVYSEESFAALSPQSCHQSQARNRTCTSLSAKRSLGACGNAVAARPPSAGAIAAAGAASDNSSAKEAEAMASYVGVLAPGHVTQAAKAACERAVESATRTMGRRGQRSSMTCQHWESKGWCRFGAECKFQHPTSKKGIGC